MLIKLSRSLSSNDGNKTFGCFIIRLTGDAEERAAAEVVPLALLEEGGGGEAAGAQRHGRLLQHPAHPRLGPHHRRRLGREQLRLDLDRHVDRLDGLPQRVGPRQQREHVALRLGVGQPVQRELGLAGHRLLLGLLLVLAELGDNVGQLSLPEPRHVSNV